MALTYDPEKNARNIALRGLSFDLVARLDWDRAIAFPDERQDYGEDRAKVLAKLDGVLHIAIVTTRGDDMRIISFRRANRAERRLYERQTENRPRGL
jgi:uncharacterized DUF497 family protein